jgi:hypothetical protein
MRGDGCASPKFAPPAWAGRDGPLHEKIFASLAPILSTTLRDIGAAIGREFSYALVTAVVREPEAELESALDRLIEAGLLFRAITAASRLGDLTDRCSTSTRLKRPHYILGNSCSRAPISMSPGEAMRCHLIRSGWSVDATEKAMTTMRVDPTEKTLGPFGYGPYCHGRFWA